MRLIPHQGCSHPAPSGCPPRGRHGDGAPWLQLPCRVNRGKWYYTAAGLPRSCPYVGPVRVRCGNRGCFVGAIPMDDMDLVVLMQEQRVVPNPAHPDFAHGVSTGVRPA